MNDYAVSYPRIYPTSKPRVYPVYHGEELTGYGMSVGDWQLYYSFRFQNITLMSKRGILRKQDVSAVISFLERVPLFEEIARGN